MQPPSEKKPGVYTYTAQWPISSFAWSSTYPGSSGDRKSRLAIGSFIDEYSNKVEIVYFNPDNENDTSYDCFSTDNRLVFDHPYSPTNLMFFPSQENNSTTNPDLIATSGDYLRLWEIHEDRIELKALLNGNKSEFNSAITSFDWANFDPRRIATSSVDTTCTIWDVERQVVDAQLVAHDKEVYDISWGGVGVFASVSGDGSVRVFDLRDKERSTIIYENNDNAASSSAASIIPQCPLLRLEWNKGDPRFIATVGMDSNKVVILDIRFPISPLMELKNKHKGSVNGVSWAPRTGRQLCSVGDDSRALIWEVGAAAVAGGFRLENGGGGGGDVEPVRWYGSTAEINQVRWSPVELDWIAIGLMNKLQLLKV